MILLKLKKIVQLHQSNRAMASCLLALLKLNTLLFAAYLNEDYLRKKNKYLALLQMKRTIFLKKMQKTRKLLQKNTDSWPFLIGIEHLYELIFSLHLLRFRVNDYTIFEICKLEMQAIEKTLSLLFLQLANNSFKKNKKISVVGFLESIQRFENSYTHTLEIVANDPSVFLFFINDLYALYDEIQLLIEST